jgi:hypothetical protein
MERYEELYEVINNVVEVESMPTMLEKARTEGEARGAVRGKAEAVLAVLRKRFETVPKEIEEEVLAMSDSIALESLLEHAIDSKTLDEFATML